MQTNTHPTIAHLPPTGDDTVWTATGHEPPVFLDESGRRRRLVLAGGLLAGGACAFWFAALIAGAVGFSTLPSMRHSVPFLATHSKPREVLTARVGTFTLRHSHDVVVSVRRPSRFVRATGLAVNRDLAAAE